MAMALPSVLLEEALDRLRSPHNIHLIEMSTPSARKPRYLLHDGTTYKSTQLTVTAIVNTPSLILLRRHTGLITSFSLSFWRK